MAPTPRWPSAWGCSGSGCTPARWASSTRPTGGGSSSRASTRPISPGRSSGCVTEARDPDPHDEGGLLTRRGRRWLIVVCVLGVLVAVGYAAAQARSSSAGRGPAAAQGQVRLGPDPGEAVPDYLARLPATLPAPGERAPALVQVDRELTTDAAAALVGSAGPAEVV